MNQLLITLSKIALKLDHKIPLLNAPANDDEISTLETRLNINLPEDYKSFLKTTNGMNSPIETEPSFLDTMKVAFLKDVEADLIEIWRETGNTSVADALHRSILVGGLDEEQMFLLIPPNEFLKHWQYWKFANWIPGEEAYEDLVDYFQNVIMCLEESFKSPND